MKAMLITLVWASVLSGCGGSDAGDRNGPGDPVSAEPAGSIAPSPSRPARPGAASPMPGQQSGLVPPNLPVRPGTALARNEIALEYSSPESTERLLAWYRGAARRGAFALGSELEEGAEHVLSGTTRSPRGEFTVRLAPGEHGGTEAMVLITAR